QPENASQTAPELKAKKSGSFQGQLAQRRQQKTKKAETPSAEALPFCCPMQLWLSCGRGSASQQYRIRTGCASAMPVQNKTRGLRPRVFVLVDGTGLEPVTSCTSSRCSTS